jgi:hypothetical protein
VLTRSEEDRAALIGRLSQRDDATWLAELLLDIETDPDDITRLRLIEGLESPKVVSAHHCGCPADSESAALLLWGKVETYPQETASEEEPALGRRGPRRP